MKRLTTALLLLCLTIGTMAQDIKMTIIDGLSDYSVKQRIERNISLLLSEVNRACAQERPLQLGAIEMDAAGRRSLEYLWQTLHFMVVDDEIVERCITSTQGYTIRNIYVEVNPMVDDYSEERDRSLTIRLTRDGMIAGVVIAASDALYQQIVRNGLDVTDFERRQTILNFVENYRSHYDEKDINALRQVFSDDALIITGTVVMKRDNQGDSPQLRPEVVYKEQSKDEYLSSLAQVFRNNKYIKVTFSDISVVRHPTNPDYYGVTLHQKWQSERYSDDGWVFLLWEFRPGRDPVIYRRTWQQDKIIKLTNGEVININDFVIPQYRQ